MNAEEKSFVMDVTDATFDQEVMQSDIPVLVDFWAAWCSPCRVLSPMLENLARTYVGQVKVAKVDVDANAVPLEYAIRSIPTVMLFNRGIVVDHWVGLRPPHDYEQGLKRVL